MLSDNQPGHAVDDKERREELTEEEQTEANREDPMPVATDPERAPQGGKRKRVVAPDEEEVAEAEEEEKGPHLRDHEDMQQV